MAIVQLSPTELLENSIAESLTARTRQGSTLTEEKRNDDFALPERPVDRDVVVISERAREMYHASQEAANMRRTQDGEDSTVVAANAEGLAEDNAKESEKVGEPEGSNAENQPENAAKSALDEIRKQLEEAQKQLSEAQSKLSRATAEAQSAETDAERVAAMANAQAAQVEVSAAQSRVSELQARMLELVQQSE